MATDEELLAKLGATEANDRAILARGSVMLPALDALVADTTLSPARRMAATRLANELRVQALRAPAAAPPATPGDDEARAYFEAGGELRSDHQQEPAAFVERLYAAGATRVTLDPERTMLIAELPTAQRAALFALYNAEVERYGEEFGGEEPPGHEMTVEEAEAIGMPAEVGARVADSLTITDEGQTRLRFWWD